MGPPPPPPPPSGYSLPPLPPPLGDHYVPTDWMAIASLVTGIISVVCCFAFLGLVLGPTAAVTGVISRRRVSRGGGSIAGRTVAGVGLLLGVLGFALSVGWFFLYAAFNIPGS